MFPTSSRSRQKQWESRPEPGVDSCFGVRSLNGSVEWEGRELRHSGEGERLQPDLVLPGMIDCSPDDGLEESDSTAMNLSDDDDPTTPPHHATSPPSPIDTLRPTTPPPPSSRLTSDILTSSHFHNLYLDNQSAPSSPASIASIPSNIASLSSLSRMSSPISGIDDSIYHARSSRRSVVDGMMIMDDLVLPSMRLPSSSLYKEVDEAGRCGRVLKVGVVGGGEVLERFMGGLRDSKILVDMRGEGGVGVVRGGEVVAVLRSMGVEQARLRVMGAYETLHSLLNPEIPSSGQVKGLVESYADKEDWLHLIIALEGDADDIRSLASFIPTISARMDKDEALYKLESTPIITPSPPHMDDPTPMPSLHTDNYFTPRTRSPSPALSDTTQSISLLHRALANPESIKQASITHFLQWRPTPTVLLAVPNLSSSESSLASRTSSGIDPIKPMPTVARAQGGKEWEATLSRRIARTRRGVRRGSRGCPQPLFPGDGVRGVSGVGIGGFRARFEGGRRKLWAGLWGGWGFVGVAAIVVAVGWGCWAKFR